MARYTEAKCKLCRSYGEKLFLKGAKCNTAKGCVAKLHHFFDLIDGSGFGDDNELNIGGIAARPLTGSGDVRLNSFQPFRYFRHNCHYNSFETMSKL